MGLADELQKLDQLRRDGVLSDAEFAQAKARLLSGETSPADASVGQHLTEHLAEVRYQNELARLDREWEMERQRFLVYGNSGRYGASRMVVPTKGAAIGVALLGGIGGALWLAMAIGITSNVPDFGPFAVAKFVFPLFGVLFICGAIGMGIYVHGQAERYEAALRAYQDRRAGLKPDRFRE